jgi:microcystin-dependent protein
VAAVNSTGQSGWSASANATTLPGCNDPNQYGTYPNCYAYDSLPVATSISGYWSAAPSGYLIEDGSAVSRATYSDLFSAIGTTYGAGDGSTTFNLPDSRGRVAVNLSPNDAEFNAMGKKYREKVHTVTIAEMPSHSHDIYANSFAGDLQIVMGGQGGDGQYYGLDDMPTDASSTARVLYNHNTGGGAPSNIIQPSIVKLSVIKYAAQIDPSAVNNTAAGTSISGYWNTIPTGYLAEDGSAVSRTTYANLFSAIGMTYGAGDGSTTFNLPDSRGRVTVNKNTSDSQFATIGQKYGEKTHVLTIAELPSHSHDIYANSFAGDLQIVMGGQGGDGQYYGLNDMPTDASSTARVLYNHNTGGSQAHNVIQPSIVEKFAIQY